MFVLPPPADELCCVLQLSVRRGEGVLIYIYIYVAVNLRNQSFHVMTDMFRHYTK